MPDLFFTITHFLDNFWPLAILTVAMLIDCLGNKKLSGTQKFWWFIFMLWLHGVGALIYFFIGSSQLLRAIPGQPKKNRAAARSTTASSSLPYYVPTRRSTPVHAKQLIPTSQPTPTHTYSDYQQGYQGYQAQPDASPQPQEKHYYDIQYDQPQATYPEMTQEQEQ